MKTNSGVKDLPRRRFLGAIRFVIKHSLLDMEKISNQKEKIKILKRINI